MVDETERSMPDRGPVSRPPDRQAVLDDVYERAAAIRRRRVSWIGVGSGLVAAVVVIGMFALVPDRQPSDVFTADLADSDSSLTTEPATTGPSTTGTAFSTSTASSVTTATTLRTSPTVVPDDSESGTTTSANVGPPPRAASSIPPENAAPRVEIVSVAPDSPTTDEEVVVTVRVIDPDSEIKACSVSWGEEVAEECGQPACSDEGYDHPQTGSTDRVDTFINTYESPGDYEFTLQYAVDACTSYLDYETVTANITVVDPST